MVEGMCGRGVHGKGMCMTGGHASQGACMAGKTATAADGMHPTGMHSCYFILLPSSTMSFLLDPKGGSRISRTTFPLSTKCFKFEFNKRKSTVQSSTITMLFNS